MTQHLTDAELDVLLHNLDRAGSLPTLYGAEAAAAIRQLREQRDMIGEAVCLT